ASDMSGWAAPAPAGSRHSTRVLPAAPVGVSGCGTCRQPASSAHAAIAVKRGRFMASQPTPAAALAAWRAGVAGARLKPRPQGHDDRALGVGHGAITRRGASSDAMFTTVAHYTDPIEAHLARGRLLSEGIEAHLGDEHLAFANWEWR